MASTICLTHRTELKGFGTFTFCAECDAEAGEHTLQHVVNKPDIIMGTCYGTVGERSVADVDWEALTFGYRSETRDIRDDRVQMQTKRKELR